jgi:nucleotide-binding universal stress UspA family protein
MREIWPSFLADLRHNAQYALDAKLGDTLPGLRPLQILRNEDFTMRSGARALVEHAHDLGAELIVLAARSKRGVARMILGSFAETLSHCSDVPLLMTRPRTRAGATSKSKEILFLTDFTEESRAAFSRLLDFAQLNGARLQILHKVGAQTYPVFELGHAYYAAYEDALNAEAVEAARLAKEMAAQATSRGIKSEVVIDRTPLSIATSAIRLAKRRGAMIALAAQASPLRAAILGSTTRELLRDAEQPVWMIHPAAEAANQAENQPNPSGQLPLLA